MFYFYFARKQQRRL